MANKILLQYTNFTECGINEKKIIDVPLMDDVFPEISTQFASFGELVPMLDKIKGVVTTVGSLGGRFSRSMLENLNKFDIPRWQKTDPIKLQVKLIFFTCTNPKDDVDTPMKELTAQIMLTYDVNNKEFIIPGISLHSLDKASKLSSIKGAGMSESSKIISVLIPNILYLSQAIIVSARPTFSKEITESGYALWGMLDMQIQSLFPANTEMFIGKEQSVFETTQMVALS